MNKIKITVAALLWAAICGAVSWAASTIDPTQPPSGQPYNSAPIRNNFQAGANDINALQGSNIGPTAPFTCNLGNQGRWWINNTLTNAWVYNVCDGPGGQWDAVFTVNPQTHQVIGPPATSNQRIVLTAPITLYVLPSGSDTNNTCTSSATPCATIQNAINRVRNNYDLAGLTPGVTIQLLNSGVTTYTENVIVSGAFLGQINPGSVQITGNAGSPTSVIINSTDPITVNHGAFLQVSNLTLQASDDCISATKFSQINLINVTFAGCANNSVHTWAQGQANFQGGTATVTAGGQCFVRAQDFSLAQLVPPEQSALTLVINNTPNFATGFACVGRLGQVRTPNVTFVGAALGPRCNANDNGVIYTATSGNPTYLPGNSACSPTNGAIYD